MKKMYNKFLVLMMLTLFINTVNVSAALFDTWAKRMPVTFEGYEKTSSLTNFPVLVKFAPGCATGFSYSDFESDRSDLRFATSNETVELNYEIESWDPLGESFVWVQVNELVDSNTLIYAYWGTNSVSVPSYTTDGSTWSNGYAAVYHLAETNGTTQIDSTANNNTVTKAGDIDMNETGVANGCDRSTDDENNWLAASDNASLDGMAALTLEVWMYDELDDTNPRGLIAKRKSSSEQKSYSFFKFQNKNLNFRVNGDGIAYSTATTTKNGWSHAVATYDSSLTSARMKLYVDGDNKGSSDVASGSVDDTTSSLYLGTLNANYGKCFQGKLDEIRISRVARSGDWVNATWLNIASNSVFNSFGDVVDRSGNDLPPIVLNDEGGADNITSSSATLNGELTFEGTTPSTTYVFWDTEDRGESGWSNTNIWAAPQEVTNYAYNASGLITDKMYYYTFFATNSAGGSWPFAVKSFLAGSPSAQKMSDAYEQGLIPGTFTVSRASTALNGPITINYEIAGTAVAGEDYVDNLGSSLELADGVESADIVVTPIMNWMRQEDSTVVLNITAGEYFVGGSSNAVMTIHNENYPAYPTNVWVATESADASIATNWSLGHPPQYDEYVVLSDEFSTLGLIWDYDGVNGVTNIVKKWIQTENYNGSVHFPISYPSYSTVFTNFTVLEDMIINGGGVYSSDQGTQNSTTAKYTLKIHIGGDFTLGVDAVVSVYGRGFSFEGPGYFRPTGATIGRAAHGGESGANSSYIDPSSYTYGSILVPNTLGSVGNYYGSAQGGAGSIWFDIEGDAVVDGIIAASGIKTSKGSGTGGSIYMKASTLAGVGDIRSLGAVADDGKPAGGGGRVAVYVIDGTDVGSVSLKAYGGESAGGSVTGAGAGTVYLQFGNEEGQIFVKNENRTTDYRKTHIPAATTGNDGWNIPRDSAEDLQYTDLIVYQKGYVSMCEDIMFDTISVDDSSLLYLEGHTLYATEIIDDQTVYTSSGIYTAADLDRVEDGETAGGQIIIASTGTIMLVR